MVAQAIRDSQGSLRAGLVLEMLLTRIEESVTKISIGTTSYASLIDNTGLVFSSGKPGISMQLHINQGDETAGYKGLSALARQILARKETIGTFMDEAHNTFLVFSSLVSEEYNWKLTVCITAAVLLGRWIGRPIRIAAAHFKELSGGAADLGKRLAIQRNDEIGAMVQDFNDFLEKLAFTGMKAVQQEISSSAVHLETGTGTASREAGKGFSVAADEIRRLAETAGAQSKTIRGKLQAIQERIQGIVQTSLDTEHAFEALNQKSPRPSFTPQGAGC
jgi:methyl-accepting chemotaxis protein